MYAIRSYYVIFLLIGLVLYSDISKLSFVQKLLQ